VPYKTFQVEHFGGLNIAEDPQEEGAGGAVDVLNVDFDRPGRIRTRDGTENWDDAAAATDYRALFAINYGNRGVLSHRNTGTSRSVDFASFGTATTQYTYMASARSGGSGTFEAWTTDGGTATDSIAAAAQIQRWDGSAFSNPVGLAAVDPKLLAVKAPDNRLVGANTATNPSRVMFSGAGTAETFGANDYVDVTPGDGEQVFGLVVWREQLFAFKQTKFFVFGNTTVGAAGTPVFNYRPVDTGIGCDYYFAAVAGDDGVYFAHRTGIYRTTGGPPERVSAPLDPLFRAGGDLDTDIFGTINVSVNHLTYVDGRVLVGIEHNPNTPADNDPLVPQFTLVYNTRTRAWSMWDITATCYTGVVIAGPEEPTLLFAPVGGLRIRQHTQGLTTDAGAAMEARYRTAPYEITKPGTTAFTRWTRLWGSGAPTVGVMTDYASTDSRAAAVTLGTAPAVAHGYHQQSYEGQLFAHSISSSSGAWVVNRVQHDIAAVKS
jgi:hypothetical protein